MDSSAADRFLRPGGALIGRFRADLRAVWPEIDDPEARLGLAVSGGPDSLALLLLAASALPGRVAVATVDHRLRPANADEAEEVAALCRRLGVAHRILPVEVGRGNLQTEARRARYAALAGWMVAEDLQALATGHHADDQAETLMLRLNRASGVSGLAGTRARGRVPGTGLALLRPLLRWRRAELGEVVEAAGLDPARDPSNLDDRFDRARIRKALGSADWLDVAAVVESASHIADADAALAWAAEREWSEAVRRKGDSITYSAGAPRAVAQRVVSRIVTELDGDEPRGGAVARVCDALSQGRKVSIGKLVARVGREGWEFARAPARRTGKRASPQ